MKPTIASSREEINKKISFLLDYNARATLLLRKQAKDFESIAEFFQSQVGRCLEIADQIATLAKMSSDLTGDIISAEFGDEGFVDEEENE